MRSLENQLRQERAANRENRSIIASLTSRTPERPGGPPVARRAEPARRRIRAWWKGQFGAAMVGVVTAFAVLTASTANSGENPLRVGGGEQEQARAPTTPATTEPAPAAPEPAPSGPAPAPTEPVATDPAPKR